MTPVSIEEAQAALPSLIAKLKPGEQVEITEADHTVARLVGGPFRVGGKRRPGSAVGKLVIHQDDDEHLDGFREQPSKR